MFKLKRGADGKVTKYKAHLVAKGFSQIEGIDYTDTFAPVASIGSIRMMLAYACAKGWLIHQMDVKAAFLHGEIQEEIYMQAPACTDNRGKVCKLRKPIYDLKQASRSWYLRLHHMLQAEGFKCNEACTAI